MPLPLPYLEIYPANLELRVRNIEIATSVPKKFRFPLFSKYVPSFAINERKSDGLGSAGMLETSTFGTFGPIQNPIFRPGYSRR